MWQNEVARKRLSRRAFLKGVGALALAGAGSSVLAACGPGAAPSSETAGYKVALLLPGAANDQGWNELAYRGLQSIEARTGAEIAYSESVAASDMVENFRGYARDGFNLVFGHGFEFGDAAQTVAAEFPETWFVITSSNLSQAPNVASFNVSTLELGFLMGAIAALMTESKVLGAIGGLEIPPITNEILGFAAGAHHIDPALRVLTALTGNFTDTAKAKEVALAMLEQGADVLMGTVDAATAGVIEAAQSRGALVIAGTGGDLNAQGPDTVLISGILDYNQAYTLIAEKVKAGAMEATSQSVGVRDGAVYLSPWHGFEEKVPQAVKDRVAEITDQISKGEIDVEGLAGQESL